MELEKATSVLRAVLSESRRPSTEFFALAFVIRSMSDLIGEPLTQRWVHVRRQVIMARNMLDTKRTFVIMDGDVLPKDHSDLDYDSPENQRRVASLRKGTKKKLAQDEDEIDRIEMLFRIIGHPTPLEPSIEDDD